MIKKTLHKYRVSKIKAQLFSDLLLFIKLYCIMMIIFILSETIFYHPTSIRYKFFILMVATPIVLATFIFLKSIINLLQINDNMNDEKLAKELGEKIPKLSDRILNSLQLSKIKFKNKLKESLSNQAIQNTEKIIRKEPIENLSLNISYFKLVSFIIIIIITLSLTALIHTSNNSLGRIYNYNQLFDPPIPFKIKANQVSISEYPSGEDVSISFKVDGPKYPKDIMLHWISNDKHDSLKIFYEDGIYTHTFYNLQNTHKYWASYKSEYFFSSWDTIGTELNEIKIIKRPEIEFIKFKVQPPAYTNLKFQEFNSGIAQINALRGSKLISEVKSDQLLSSCKIIRNSTDTLELNKKNDKWNAELELNNNESIEIAIYNNKKLKNEIPLLYKIKILDDLGPDIYMIEPNQKNFEINNQSQVSISFKTNDDYGLNKSWVEYNITKSNSIDSDSTVYSILLNEYSRLKRYQENYIWDLSPFNLYPGDRINFRVLVKDNSPNQSVTKTDYYHAIYPTFENIFTDLESREDEIKDMSNEVLSQIESLDEIIEDIELDLLKASNIDWEQQQKAEESINQMEEIFNNIENMQNAIEKLQDQADKGNKVDDKLIQKFEKFQDMLESIMTPELLEALQKMQEALDNMDIKDMLEAANNLDYNLDQFEQQIDRFMEMFELAIAEQKLNELIESLELMSKKQESIKNKFNNNEDLSNLRKMQNQQNKQYEKLQETMSETKQSVEKFSEQTTKAIEQLIMSKQNQDAGEKMSLAEEKISKNDITAINEISESKNKLESMYNMAKSIKEDFEEEQVSEMIEVFYSVIRNILKLSEYQENLSLNFENIRSSSPSLKILTAEQFIISKQFINFIENLMDLSTKTFYIKPEINSKIGYCKKNIDNSIINLEQRKIRNAKSNQNEILSSMNEIALMLINAMDEMQNSGSPSGLESYMEELQKIGEGQSQINMSTMQLGQMGMMSKQEIMKRLESEQKALKDQLEQILKECSGGGEEHGGLSKAAEDMDDIIRDFQQNKITKETEQKQQKILSRLLDSQKSLKEREFSEKRKSEVAHESINYSSPINLPNNLGNNNLLFIDAMEEALEQGYSNEYKKMFRKYYRDLQENESK